MAPAFLARWPRVVRALLAHLVAFALLAQLPRLGLRLGPWQWAGLQGALAALLGAGLRLPPWWIPLQVLLPFLLVLRLAWAYPAWVDLLLLGILALVYGGGLVTRVPLYNASRDAWTKLESLLPARPGLRFIDLGCGLGGPIAHLASARPGATFRGVEASPLPWLVAWLRNLGRPGVQIRLGSLWEQDLSSFDVVYAFLSPEPMAALWAKASKEMKPGSLLVSHSFAVPGVPPNRELPVQGRQGARLLVWELGAPARPQ